MSEEPQIYGQESTQFINSIRGQVLRGRYKVSTDKPLGTGGFGVVFAGRDLKINRPVAIKVLMPPPMPLQMTEEGRRTITDSLGRFRREAGTAGAVKSDNVVTIYDFDRDDRGLHYIVMELVNGWSMKDELRKREHFTPSQTVHIITQVLEGLEAIHVSGIVHRDLKPANIMLGQWPNGDLHVKLCDFGISKWTAPANGEGHTMTALTAPGMVPGTPTYVSPEQFQGKQGNSLSDIYSIGVIMYEMLTGKPPFKGGPTGVTLAKEHLKQAPPPIREHGALSDLARDSITPELERFVLRALAKKPSARWASALEMREALLACRITPHKTSQRVMTALLALGLAVPCIGAVDALLRGRDVVHWPPWEHVASVHRHHR